MAWYREIWEEGRVIDFWSVPHLFAGSLLAALGHYLGMTAWQVAFPALILLIGWEFFEAARGIEESWPNRIMDVVLGVAGFFLMSLAFASIGGSVMSSVTMLMLFAWAVLNLWGFLAYLRHRR